MKTNISIKKLFSAGIWVSGGILLGRLAGFLREIFVASKFGISEEADAILFSLVLPDFLTGILIGGALSAALIPEFKSSTSEISDQLFLKSSIFCGILFLFISLLLSLNSNILIDLLAPGFNDKAYQEASHLLKWVLWLIPLTVLSAITTSYLQSKDHFAIPAMGTLIFNICLILALLFFVKESKTLYFLGIAVLIGGFLRWFSQFMGMVKKGWQWTSLSNWNIPKPLVKRYFQAFGAGGLVLLFPILARAFGSIEGPGGYAFLNYAIKFVELPMGVCIGVFSSILFPKLSEYFAENRLDESFQLISNGTLLIFIFSYGIILIFYGFSETLTKLAFEWGVMPNEGIKDLTFLVMIGILALPAQGLLSLQVAISNAKKDTHLPLQCSLIGIAIFLPLVIFFSQWKGLIGIMTALVSTYWFLLVVQIILLKRRHGIQFLSLSFYKEVTQILFTGYILLIPFIWVEGFVPNHAFSKLIIISLATLIVLLGSLLIIKRYRIYLVNQLKVMFRA